jgi:hypothetical protein
LEDWNIGASTSTLQLKDQDVNIGILEHSNIGRTIEMSILEYWNIGASTSTSSSTSTL